MDKGALLMKGETGWVTRLYPFIATAVMLWLIGAIVQNMIPEKYAVYWDYVLMALVLLTMYFGTRNWVNHRLYEHGLELFHPLTGRKEFRAFNSMLRFETHRNNISTRYNRANYVDVITLYFEDGTVWELSGMELDNFHEFRNLLMQLHEDAQRA